VKRQIIQLAGMAGAIGPGLFGGVLLTLSVLQYEFMLGIGWQPMADPAGAWPSGLALGPYGAAQIANFLVSGFLLCLFALGLHLRHVSPPDSLSVHTVCTRTGPPLPDRALRARRGRTIPSLSPTGRVGGPS